MTARGDGVCRHCGDPIHFTSTRGNGWVHTRFDSPLCIPDAAGKVKLAEPKREKRADR